MSPGVRNFIVGLLCGAAASLVLITYYGDLGGDFLIKMGHKMKTATHTVVKPKPATDITRRVP